MRTNFVWFVFAVMTWAPAGWAQERLSPEAYRSLHFEQYLCKSDSDCVAIDVCATAEAINKNHIVARETWLEQQDMTCPDVVPQALYTHVPKCVHRACRLDPLPDFSAANLLDCENQGHWRAQQACFHAVAKRTADPAGCAKMGVLEAEHDAFGGLFDTAQQAQACAVSVLDRLAGEEKLTELVCAAFSGSALAPQRADCYTQLAHKAGDPTICLNIEDQGLRTACIGDENVASLGGHWAITSKNTCDAVKQDAPEGWYDQCLFSVAAKTREVEICHEINQQNIDLWFFCIRSLALAGLGEDACREADQRTFPSHYPENVFSSAGCRNWVSNGGKFLSQEDKAARQR